MKTKITIVGAGVIGLAIAYKLSSQYKDVVVIERQDSFGRETSSRNSEIIHAGLYYQPKSLKTLTCLRGNKLLYDLCLKHNIAHKRIGKLVVASDDLEVVKIKKTYQNALDCQVKNLRFLEKHELKSMEPSLCAIAGFYSSDTGIIDSHALMQFLYNKAKENGVTFSFNTEVKIIEKSKLGYKVIVKEPNSDEFSFETKVLINSAGLWADKIAALAGIDIEKCKYKLHYCKGQYFRLRSPEKFNIKHLIYPPETQESLGIHFTLDLASGIRLGPDAFYVDVIDYTIEEGARAYFLKSVKKYLPSLVLDDLTPDTSGIRPKLQAKGADFEDFIIKEESSKGFPGLINLIGIESPGLTACLAIAEIVEKMVK